MCVMVYTPSNIPNIQKKANNEKDNNNNCVMCQAKDHFVAIQFLVTFELLALRASWPQPQSHVPGLTQARPAQPTPTLKHTPNPPL